MSEKHLPYIGGNFDRIVFNGDGSTWVREQLGTRYTELFGTPQLAARTMIDTLAACEGPQCTSGRCPFRQMQHCPDYDDYDALLEWLRGDAE